MINRTFPIIVADDVAATRDFYTGLLGFRAVFDSDWFVDLQSPDEPLLEIGIWRRGHELLPPGLDGPPRGVLIDVVVDDVDTVHAAAQQRGLPVAVPLRDEPYGQRRFVTTDPAGSYVEISTPIAMSPTQSTEPAEVP